jgi:integrase/recombinase XerD
METLFEQFIREWKYFRNLAETTLYFYRETFKQFKTLEAFEDLSKQSLQEAIIKFRERGTSIRAINTYIRGINVFLNWLHQEHNYDNFTLKLLKCDKRNFRTLTESELKTIVRFEPNTFTEKRLKTILLVMIDTGIRINEAINIERSKIDFENLLLSVIGKRNKERIIPFSYELRKVIFKYSATHSFELLFCTKNGCKVSYNNILRDFYILVKKLGIQPDGAFHAFRRTFVTNYVRNGGNALLLQRMLGHTTLQQTNVYIKLVSEDLQKEQHRTSLLNRLRYILRIS